MLLPKRANRQILFVDMNSFFASCEQAENPALIGKPVIVIPTEGSCALAASYEAKAFGIRTGTLEKEARFRCPQLIAVKARPKIYMDYHDCFVRVLENISPRVTVRSVDEASLELFSNEDPWELGREIKQAIWRELGTAINCSIGIGPNVFLAKLGTELQKPDGLVEIRLEDLSTVYEKVGLRDLCGINFAMERQLQRLGIFSVTDFYQAAPEFLREHLGVTGYRWWLQLHGYTSYEKSTERKSLSHSHVLPPAYRDPKAALVTLRRLAAKVGRRLRREGYLTSHIALFIRFTDRTGAGQQLQITPAADTITINDHLTRLWQQINPQTPILKLAIWTTHLTPASGIPLPLFEEDRRRLRLAQALDTINDRHGADMIRFAIIDTKGSRAPDRIAFNSLFKIEHE